MNWRGLKFRYECYKRWDEENKKFHRIWRNWLWVIRGGSACKFYYEPLVPGKPWMTTRCRCYSQGYYRTLQ